MNSRVVFMLMAAAGLSGCINTSKKTQLPQESIAALHGRTIALTERPQARLVSMTAGKLMLAMVGAAPGTRAGEDLKKQDGIEDGAHFVAEGLLRMAQQKYGVVPAQMNRVKTDTTDVKLLAQAAGGSDLLMDVQSPGQTISYFTLDWTHYWVGSGFVVRLIDVRKGIVIGEDACARSSKNASHPPTHAELLAEQGQLLKQTLHDQWASCLDELAMKVLAMKVEGSPQAVAPSQHNPVTMPAQPAH
jgi:hypothetical protein